MWVCISTLLLGLLALTGAHQNQRIPPGVPPQQYHQQAPHQHQVPINQQVPQFQQQNVPQMHQVPLQQQQMHQQQQQMPVQQQQMPVQQQQMPVQQQQMHQQQQVPQVHQQQLGQQGHQQPHGHQPPQMSHQGMGHQGGLLNVGDMMHEKEHLQEHMEIPMDTSKMSEQELQFHYFKMHDADNNNKLDGCELIKSLIHWHEQGHQDPNNVAPGGEKVFLDEELLQLIDPILGMDDRNKDGFIDYPEFVQAQHKAAATGGQAAAT